MKKLLLTGILLGATAMQSARADVTCPRCNDWSTVPLIIQPRFSSSYTASEEEEAGSDAAAEAARSNGTTTFYGNEPPHWDPTMADAPSWLTRRYTYKPRMRR